MPRGQKDFEHECTKGQYTAGGVSHVGGWEEKLSIIDYRLSIGLGPSLNHGQRHATSTCNFNLNVGGNNVGGNVGGNVGDKCRGQVSGAVSVTS